MALRVDYPILPDTAPTVVEDVMVHPPTVTIQEEPFSEVLPELQALWGAHYREIAQDQDRMPLDVDIEAYLACERAGMLSVVTLRVDATLVGYFISVIRTHMHYRQNLCASVDVYYVHPAYRKGFLPVRLFRQAEQILKARGVQKVSATTKVYADVGPLFRRCQWRLTETVYTKWIGA